MQVRYQAAPRSDSLIIALLGGVFAGGRGKIFQLMLITVIVPMRQRRDGSLAGVDRSGRGFNPRPAGGEKKNYFFWNLEGGGGEFFV